MSKSAKLSRQKLLHTVSLAVCLLATWLQAGALEPLKPGQRLRFDFPDLTATLSKATPGISIRLPKNYQTTKKFPLFVILPGGTGGNGTNTERQLAIVGENDWIVATFPLFGADGEGIFIGFDCYPKIKISYEAFLKKIRESVPNVDWEKSVIGGSSNGAHTLAALLSAMDTGILEHFKGFFFIDGGQDLTIASLMRFGGAYGGRKRDGYRFLMIFGGGAPEKKVWWRVHTVRRAESFKDSAEQFKIKDFEVVLYPGKEHGFHKEYYPIVAEWLENIRSTLNMENEQWSSPEIKGVNR